MGPVSDPQIMDWRDCLERLQAAKPTATADAFIRSLKPGQKMLVVQPIIRSSSWRAPWTSLIRKRSVQWAEVLNEDPRLSRVLASPKLSGKPLPRGVRTVLYERL
jgi:hypothetical protein